MESLSAKKLLYQIKAELEPTYDQEAESISFMLLEALFNLDRTSVITNSSMVPDRAQLNNLSSAIEELKLNKPIQYVLGKAHFYGNDFLVNEHTLIPRPETEELVRIVLEHSYKFDPCRILDIGTGSGCIPITLALENAKVSADSLDISKEATKVARENADNLNAKVSFIEADIFSYDTKNLYNIIVSNPPYVLEDEKALMAKNVLDYEPEQALFVPNHSPLMFYEHIVKKAREILLPGGMLFFEINEQYGRDVSDLLQNYNFTDIRLKQDLSGRDRFVYGRMK